eukprot:4184586-Prymnesium_polylepis.1
MNWNVSPSFTPSGMFTWNCHGKYGGAPKQMSKKSVRAAVPVQIGAVFFAPGHTCWPSGDCITMVLPGPMPEGTTACIIDIHVSWPPPSNKHTLQDRGGVKKN